MGNVKGEGARLEGGRGGKRVMGEREERGVEVEGWPPNRAQGV